MKQIILVVLAFVMSSSLYAYSDSDMDGVDDAHDRCPNTSFMELVDINGCAKKSLVSKHHFDIIVGGSYAESDYNTLNKTDTYYSTLQADYYYGNFSLQASTSYFDTEGSGYSQTGLYDSYVGASYQFRLSNLLVRVGAGALLPTYDSALKNNNTDYVGSASLSYALGDFNIFGGYTYTKINDDDVVIVASDGSTTDVIYQNTNSYNGGLGYYLSKKFYMSVSYNSAQSIYDGVDNLESASLYGYYSFSRHWFGTFSYAYGLSDTASKNYAALRAGYYF